MDIIDFEFKAQNPVKINIDGSFPTHTISKHIYGHFSEHLGRCVYDGYWVSDTMKVAKKRSHPA